MCFTKLTVICCSVLLLSVTAHAQTMSGKGVDTSGGASGYAAQLALKDLQTQVSGNTNIISGNSTALSDQSARLDGIDSHLSTIDQRLDALETSLNNINTSLQTITTTLNTVTTTQNTQNNTSGTDCSSRLVNVDGGNASVDIGTPVPVRASATPANDFTEVYVPSSGGVSGRYYRLSFQCSGGHLVFRSAVNRYHQQNGRFGGPWLNKTCISNDGVNCVYTGGVEALVVH